MFAKMLTDVEAVRELLEGAGEARTNAEAVVRIELANVLARADVLLGALAADEEQK